MKVIRNVVVVLLFSIAVASCYWSPQSTEGSIVVELGGSPEKLDTMTIQPLAKPDNPGENSNNNAGSNSSNNAGGNSENNAGGNSENNAGGNSENNAGGNSENNAGGNSSNNAGGNSSNNAGGNSENNAGGNSGNNAGGNSSNNAGGPLANGPEPTTARVYLFQYQETMNFDEEPAQLVFKEVDLLSESPSVVIDSLPIGDGYFARVQLGDWPDGVDGEFRVLLADDSQRFKIFSGRITNIRVNLKPVKDAKK